MFVNVNGIDEFLVMDRLMFRYIIEEVFRQVIYNDGRGQIGI